VARVGARVAIGLWVLIDVWRTLCLACVASGSAFGPGQTGCGWVLHGSSFGTWKEYGLPPERIPVAAGVNAGCERLYTLL
jgi:hypothetical protein